MFAHLIFNLVLTVHPWIYSSSKHLLSTSCVPDTIWGIEDTALKQNGKKKEISIFTSLDVSGCRLNINKSVSKYLAARGWQVPGRKMQPSNEMPSPETKASLMRWAERKKLRPKKKPSVRVLRKMLACAKNSKDNVAGAKVGFVLSPIYIQRNRDLRERSRLNGTAPIKICPNPQNPQRNYPWKSISADVIKLRIWKWEHPGLWGWPLSPLASVLLRERRGEDREGNNGAPGMLTDTRSWRRWGRILSRASRGRGPKDTLISDFWPSDWKRTHFCSLQPLNLWSLIPASPKADPEKLDKVPKATELFGWTS